MGQSARRSPKASKTRAHARVGVIVMPWEDTYDALTRAGGLSPEKAGEHFDQAGAGVGLILAGIAALAPGAVLAGLGHLCGEVARLTYQGTLNARERERRPPHIGSGPPVPRDP